MNPNENAPAPVEAPNPPPADAPPAAPPPAADLVTRGVVRSERELALEAELEAARRETATEREARRKAEFAASERERVAQELLSQTRAKPDAKPVPPKVRKFGPLQILRGEED